MHHAHTAPSKTALYLILLSTFLLSPPVLAEAAGAAPNLLAFNFFGDDSDDDGIPDNRDICPETPAGLKVGENGCPQDADGDGIFDYLDRCPQTAAGSTVDVRGCSQPQLAQSNRKPEQKRGAGGSDKITRSQEALLISEGGVLLPKGKLVIEPGLQYSYTSRTRIAISGFTIFQSVVLGDIVSEDVERHIITGFLNLRYGLTSRLQIETKIPYLYRHDETTFATGPSGNDLTQHSVDGIGIGDIEASLLWHAFGDLDWWAPQTIFYLRAKSRTGKDPYGLNTITIDGKERTNELPFGNGHYGLAVGTNCIVPTDPAVLYFNLGYYFNFKRNVGNEGGVDYGEIDPGDSVEFGLGMAYALNDRLTTSLSFQQRFTFDSEQNGHTIMNSNANVGTVYLGTTYSISDSTALTLSLGIGLTDDAPDFSIDARLPISF
ncbi:thrombospondin type 3 repeat-containing protein [Geothermobacter ehrlichii]|uniref:Thrombospondin type 3 repeat-containing protein n=1 Tax=Geothermobacter ehrlichii TaxID=213224 RepID=A0A5D3WJ59_9BACT|nr:thrombospondin type 3 repeat-containing protein [Geothermobacter ehrlichii]TYO97535.1 thrombospondin type 3 repeat-containing protein [Geothermobacter ehrlichii]